MLLQLQSQQEHNSINDFRAGAAWRGTIVDHQLDGMPTSHAISNIPGVSGYSFAYDTLHILEEGVSSHCVANLFFDTVVKTCSWEGTQEAKLKKLFMKIQEKYHELGTEASNKINRLTMSNFCDPKNKSKKFPDLSGMKARKIRYLVPVAMELALELKDDDHPYSKHRYLCLKHLNKVYELIDAATGTLHFSQGQVQDYKKATDLMLQHYTACSTICMSKGLLQWNTVHKYHLCAHMPDQAKYLNPKYLSTYGGETMVGFIASLGHHMLNGTPGHLVPEKVCWRYRLAMWLRLSGSDFEEHAED